MPTAVLLIHVRREIRLTSSARIFFRRTPPIDVASVLVNALPFSGSNLSPGSMLV